MKQRKPILIIDDSINSQRIKKIFYDNELEFVEYHIKKFEESCCGELSTTKAPSVIAAEGIYRDEEGIENYIKYLKEIQKKQRLQNDSNNNKKVKEESESAYW
ncbi:MAG: hypothetical protein M3Z01_01555 [Thermoproteota archaeon]|nr:hypothetical protein [Thermoproteota archaeon]